MHFYMTPKPIQKSSLNSINIEMTDYNIFNKYAIYKLNQYIAINTKNYSFWEYIQVDFGKFKAKYFDMFYDYI